MLSWESHVKLVLQTSDGGVEIADGIAIVRESLTTLAWRLHNDLNADVFDEENDRKHPRCL